MENRKTSDGLSIVGRIDINTYNSEELKRSHENWDELSKKEKLSHTRTVEPVETQTSYNVTTDSLHEYFVDNLDAGNTNPEANVSVEWVAIGNSGDGTISTADSDLNNRTYEETVTDIADNGKELLASTFIDSTEANAGGPFDEIGLFSADPDTSGAEVFMINHASFADVTKDNTKTVTFDVTLQFSDV